MVKKLLYSKLLFKSTLLFFVTVFSSTQLALASNATVSLLKSVNENDSKTTSVKAVYVDYSKGKNLSFADYLWVDTPIAEAGFKEVFQNAEVMLLKIEDDKKNELNIAIAPQVICKNITIQLDNTGNVNISPSDIEDGTYAGNPSYTLTASKINFDCSNLGSNNVTLTLTELSDSTSTTCTAIVTVVDAQAPTLTGVAYSGTTGTNSCKTDAETAAPFSALNAVNGYTDNCGGSVTAVLTNTVVTGTDDAWTVTYTFTVSDANGNSLTGQTYSNTGGDQTIPITPTLADVTGECSVTATVPTTTDNCEGTITGTTTDSLTYTTQGTHVITWTFDDGNGNTTTATQNVVIDDVTVPVTPTLADVTGECSATATAPTTTDNCEGTITGTTTDSLTYTTQGTTVVTWTFDDGNGNTTTANQNIIVDDISDPTLTAITDRNETVGSGCNFTIPDYTGLTTANDNCTATASIIKTQSPVVGTVINGHNTTQLITITADDGNGNTASTSFTITLKDVTNPVLTPGANQNVNINASCSIVIPDVRGTATDNCTVTITQSPVVGTTVASSHNATTNVTVTATDAAGNTDIKTVVLTAKDVTNPTITCPSNQNVSFGANCQFILPDYTTLAIASDNCSTPVITQSPVTGTSITGQTTVTLTATDSANNSTTCTFEVIPSDNEPPTASNLPPITASGTAPNPDISLVNDEADNCTANPEVTWLSDVSDNNTCPEVITRTYKVTDNAGNSINVTQTITVEEIIPPVARCKDNVIVQLSNIDGTVSITATDIDNGSTDNCGIASMSVVPNTFDCDNIGNNLVTLEVTDIYGNIATCNTTVIVEAPIVDGGVLTGYLDTDIASNASEIIDITSCPYDTNGNPAISNAHLNLTIPLEFQDNIVRWEYSTNGGYSWTSIANTSTYYFYSNITVTTLVRAVIEVGSCVEYSPRVILNVIPPHEKPTIIGDNTFDICLGASVTVEAESQYGVPIGEDDGGLFNWANPYGWRVNGDDDFIIPAASSNEKNELWAETTNQNGGRDMNGTLYNALDPKYAIVHGDLTDPKIKIKGVRWNKTWSSLETPIFNTLGLNTATLQFDQAYFLEDTAWLKIELSLDGGQNYNITLDPGINPFNNQPHNYTGPSTSGVGTHMENFVATSIDLQDYIGMTGLRIRFMFEGGSSKNSSWALDNILIPDKPIDEIIEWTNENGDIITTGYTTSITTNSPGIQTYGATTLINACRAPGSEGTEYITINASYAYAGKEISPVVGECGNNTVTLNAYDNTKTANENKINGAWDDASSFDLSDDPGTGEIGTWTVKSSPSSACGADYSFSNPNNPQSKFTGQEGTYILTWTVSGCPSDVTVTLNSCSNVNFDGVDDFVTFGDNYDFSAPFSIESWVKPNSVTGTQTIISKRNANNKVDGYDLKLVDNILSFNWNNGGNITSPFIINTDRWYHIAVTFNGSVYKLYIDGIEVANGAGAVPVANTYSCILGAMDQTGSPPNKPINYFNGWMDELRIWNKTLSIDHIRQMMNQEIKLSGADDVMGEIIPMKISGPDADKDGVEDNILLWSNLSAYYKMGVDCGYLTPVRGVKGRLRNIYTQLEDTAPIPYTSRVDGQNWGTDNTWTLFDVWDPPNSTGVNGEPIDWNIVKISHNINSGDRDITLLGLLSETSGKLLTMADPIVTSPIENNDGQGLWITHYLKLNGNIDLVGESQLLQKRYGTYDSSNNFSTAQFSESILEPSSTGYIERDQHGTRSSYNYNYWSSPVSKQGAANNVAYRITDVLKDGTNSNSPLNINFVGGAYSADGARTSPIKLSNYWFFKFNGTSNDYWSWSYIGSTGSLPVGDGYTMKGTDGTASISDRQNYVFRGKPHNENITLNISAGNNRLIGNPYPSALDANEFILDHIKDSGGRNVANVFNGTLYFWDHFSGKTHILREYVGGYATYTLLGGVAAIANDARINATGGNGTNVPERYIPVGQGFFINATIDSELGASGIVSPIIGGAVVFKNSQRVSQREVVTGAANSGSVFLKSSAQTQGKNPKQNESGDARIRLIYDSPLGYHRQLLAGVNENTTNNFDLGYDALLADDAKEDMYWMVNKGKLVIQGVNNFDKDQVLPIGVKVNSAGLIRIKLEETKYLDNNVSLFIKDFTTGKSERINKKPFEIYLEPGEYNDRFALTFNPSKNNKKEEETILENEIYTFMNNVTSELQITNHTLQEISNITLYNYLGQSVGYWDKNLSKEVILLPIKNATGVYVVQINTPTGVINKRIVVE